MPAPDPADVVRRHADRLMAVSGVVGVAEGAAGGRPCVLVLVARRTAAIVADIPQWLDGLPTRIVETGTPEALEPPEGGTLP
jgi:hypothetical protein